ncbi:hypothetical protein LSAT2_023860, partial [Lamellibrachia satsuma]
MFNALLCTFEKLNVGFRDDQVDTLGKRVVDTVFDALWYLDRHRQMFKDRGICLGDTFTALSDYVNYEKAHKRCPKMYAEMLKEHVDNLSELLLHMWSVHHQSIFTAIHQLSSGM